jgi:ATP-dependent DNA helicase RecG
LQKAQLSLKFEELFYLQLQLLEKKQLRLRNIKGFEFSKIDTHFNTFYKHHLPFELTGAQKRVLKEIRKDLGSGVQMNRLLQGDVGSGKTMVAVLSALIAIDNGYQCCIMAPTEILAKQHYHSISTLLEPLEINVKILTGSTKKKERDSLHQGLSNGDLQILIGTHALIEDKVVFKNLGLAVIDEQHRFGVAQRSKLWKKSKLPPHVLVMTATPIPRTLAMSYYGDLDLSVIDELPPGRKPISTAHRTDASRLRVLKFVKDEIAKGRQVYFVYPLIKESENLDYKDLMDGYHALSRDFPMPEYQISIVHGQMKSEEKEFEMQRFIKNKTQIMVATTVIEVGVNIPNASIMIIESAERFGLSQLHQLRGRVGRGSYQSHCVLMTSENISDDSKQRIESMVQTNDGFKLAEIDLNLRGPGDLMGTQQSGVLNLKVSDLVKDSQILHLARKKAEELFREDELLLSEKNKIIKDTLVQIMNDKAFWSYIS